MKDGWCPIRSHLSQDSRGAWAARDPEKKHQAPTYKAQWHHRMGAPKGSPMRSSMGISVRQSVLEQSTPLACGVMARRTEVIGSHPSQVESVLCFRRTHGEPFVELAQFSLLSMALGFLLASSWRRREKLKEYSYYSGLHCLKMG